MRTGVIWISYWVSSSAFPSTPMSWVKSLAGGKRLNLCRYASQPASYGHCANSTLLCNITLTAIQRHSLRLLIRIALASNESFPLQFLQSFSGMLHITAARRFATHFCFTWYSVVTLQHSLWGLEERRAMIPHYGNPLQQHVPPDFLVRSFMRPFLRSILCAEHTWWSA